MNNFYEESIIDNDKLPKEWQSSLKELEEFLQDNWNKRYLFYDDLNKSSNQQFLSFNLSSARTNNYIGTICYNGNSINIFPKVFKNNINDNDASSQDIKHMIKNLCNWISYINKTSYPFINFNYDLDECNNLKELFITLYLNYILDALKKTSFYKYESINDDIKTIRGRFNLSDYINNKISNAKMDTFNCEYSIFDYDNLLNRIIKYVCRLIYNYTNFNNQIKIRKILSRLIDVSDVKCVASDCDKVILNKEQQSYKLILNMSKMFLLNQLSSFKINDNDNFCFLFPTEMLFEGFIGSFIKNMLNNKAEVKLQCSNKLFKNIIYDNNILDSNLNVRYDIYVKYNNKVFILDTKYKIIPSFKNINDIKNNLSKYISSNDIYQILTYALVNDLSDVYLLYPLLRYEDIEESDVVGVLNSTKNINVHFVRLPFIFEDNDINITNVLSNELNKIFK